jgi:hypothetical protein
MSAPQERSHTGRPMRVLLLLLLLLAIASRAQEAATVGSSVAADEATAGGSTTEKATIDSKSSPQVVAGDEDLIISEEVPVSSGSGSTNESPVADVIDASSPSSTSSETAATAATAADDAIPPASQGDQSSSSSSSSTATSHQNETSAEPVQAGPFIDLLGPHLLSLEMVDPTHAQLVPHYTNEALRNKKVVGLYFSADWYAGFWKRCRLERPHVVVAHQSFHPPTSASGAVRVESSRPNS